MRPSRYKFTKKGPRLLQPAWMAAMFPELRYMILNSERFEERVRSWGGILVVTGANRTDLASHLYHSCRRLPIRSRPEPSHYAAHNPVLSSDIPRGLEKCGGNETLLDRYCASLLEPEYLIMSAFDKVDASFVTVIENIVVTRCEAGRVSIITAQSVQTLLDRHPNLPGNFDNCWHVDVCAPKYSHKHDSVRG